MRITLAVLLLFLTIATSWKAYATVDGFDIITRGDVDDNGIVDNTDAINLLGYLNSLSYIPGCLEACDANDDGWLDNSDPIYILDYVFLGGDPPPAPGPLECGIDPTPSAYLTCDYTRCDYE